MNPTLLSSLTRHLLRHPGGKRTVEQLILYDRTYKQNEEKENFRIQEWIQSSETPSLAMVPSDKQAPERARFLTGRKA